MKVVGHRGARGLAPENTLLAIRKGLGQKVDEIEIDVRVTKDSVPVLIHDRTFLRLTGKYIHVGSHTLKELRKHKPDLETLEEAISYTNRRVPLVIEVKPGEPITPIVETINNFLTRGWQPDDFLLASYSQKTLLALQSSLPQIEKVINERFLSVWATHRARQIGARRLVMNQLFLWAGVIAGLNFRGYKLYAYPLNQPRKAKRWVKYGLAGVITDHPERFPRS